MDKWGWKSKDVKKIRHPKWIHQSGKIFGRTTDKQKFELMQKAHVLCATSIKEGWGLIVSEVNSQGTPAISYDVDGLRDSTTVGGGVITKPNPQAMSQALEVLYNLVNNQPKVYINLQTQALESTKNITYQQSYKDLKKILDK
ncbi:glycosyltransferase [Candidatus Gracilibacteria bacterium]|nr:glycosyltransferase [Candidatus Gracilibacteria bacterium]NJS41544.1 glycosyltransferase [Candidatus Gracilibacteria bacterium]